ncbi:hypothetical protein [Prosthecobacter sp.]|uniref:hypothetical protein n=1 Tax=Prosthecobacter sp. TaxID=1965333 RepID=UPI002488CE8B|nr:hypothetical protein [Prosthecobacter sp.]MDI1312708.1 hypothetical protein [Prosthecobacter sp.]
MAVESSLLTSLTIFSIAVFKTHFRLAGCLLIADHGLPSSLSCVELQRTGRRRLAEDSQPYQRWGMPTAGRAFGPPSAVERRHAPLSGNLFWKTLYVVGEVGALIDRKECLAHFNPSAQPQIWCELDGADFKMRWRRIHSN